MIALVYHPHFLTSARPLPKAQQKKLSELLVLLERNPFHPLLHTKRLSGALLGFLSFRITRDWRVVFRFRDPQTIQLLRVAHRKDIYRS